MSEINMDPATTESVVMLSETSSTLCSSSPSNTLDDESRRRRILSKLWGKGNKLSHKVRELEKSTASASYESSIHIDNNQKLSDELLNNVSTYSSTNDLKSSTEDSSNSINGNKPLAVVKPIVMIKSGLIVSSATDRVRVNSEVSSVTVTQMDETISNTSITTVIDRQSLSSSTTTDQTSSKKKKNHKDKDLKKKKKSKEKSVERDQIHRHHHSQINQMNTSKKRDSSTINLQQNQAEEILKNDNHSKSSRQHSSSSTSVSQSKQRSNFNNTHCENRQSSRSTIAKKDDSTSSRKQVLSPVDRHHSHSSSKYERNIDHNSSSSRHHRHSSRTSSRSPIRSYCSTSNKDRLQNKSSLSPKARDHSSATTAKSNRQQTELISNSKSSNSISPTDVYSKARSRGSDIIDDYDAHQQKKRTNDVVSNKFSKSEKLIENSPEYRPSSSSVVKQDTSKSISNNEKNEGARDKPNSSRYDRRSHSRHRSKSKENKANRNTVETLNSDDSLNNQIKTKIDKNSSTSIISGIENSSMHKKSTRTSPIPTSNEDRRRKSSDYHAYDRHGSPSNYDRRNDSHHYRHHDSYHRNSSSHSYYPHTHYVHHHHHHHYRSTSSRYYDRRRSISPRSHHRRSRYFSSTSSSLSPSPRRRSSSRTSSLSTRSSSSYSSISRTSSSRSSSRNHHYYHDEKPFRRSPTLEKIFLKASESIESVSTQKNPTTSSSSSSTTTTGHLIPSIQASNNMASDIQISSSISSLSEANKFYSENFSGFSAPPPPFIPQPQQRYLKEITTDSVMSHRLILNEAQTVKSSTSTSRDEIISVKTIPPNDPSNNVRSNSNKPPRVSRFSDIAPTVVSEPQLNINLPVDTALNYTQISENMNCLSSSRRQQKRHNREVMECECTTSEYDRSRGVKACGQECLNRMLLIECGPKCPCGQWCTNRRFQRHSYANHKIALFKTEMKGYGLRTIAPIRKGRFLVEYVGEVIDMDELARRNKKYKRDGNVHQYVMSLIHGTVIDSTIKGNWARFINHSCEPNCVAEKWLVNGEYHLGIFATRDLNINEELTIDYRFETFGTTDLTNEKCYCGAPTCRGTISVRNTNNNNFNQKQDRRQPLDDDEILEYLLDSDTNEYVVPKTVDEIRQLIQIMSRTDSENVRTIELDLIRNGSQKQFELPRLFLECNGLHVLCSWMKDILIEDDEQQYSNEFKYHLLDFIHSVLPIKDRTTVIKNGLLDLVYQKLKLPLRSMEKIDNNDEEQINYLMKSMLDHLDDQVIAKLFHLYSTWMSLKERYIIPKRKESEQLSNHHHRHHHHHHHHHHGSKHPHEENNYRFNFTTRPSIVQPKTIDRTFGRRSFIARDASRTQEQQLSKDERRKLFEQQYEDAERARAAAAAAAANTESPIVQNEPPQKKQRTTDNTEPIVPNTPPQPQHFSTSTEHSWPLPSHAAYGNHMDQTYWIHQHLSQIPVEYISSYMISIGQTVSVSSASTDKDEPPLPPPPRPNDENELRRIISLPSGWSVAMCPSDSSVYFYNRTTMQTSWTPPSQSVTSENAGSPITSQPPLDLSPLSSAQIHGQHRPDHDPQQFASSSHSSMKVLKHSHRHNRNHRHHQHHHHHHHMISNNKRKRLVTVESTTSTNQEISCQPKEEALNVISSEQFKQEEPNDKKSLENNEDMCVDVFNSSIDQNNQYDVPLTVKETSVIDDNPDKDASVTQNNLLSSSKINRDLLRKNISQHVHATLKPYTKRTCKQGRITSTDDIKYLVKKFTLAVLDKEIEKAKNDGIALSPVLTERVRLKTEVYVKKYMNKVGPIFQRHDSNTQSQQHTTFTAPTARTMPNSE